MGEHTILSRAGGAPTGRGHGRDFQPCRGRRGDEGLWYHFAILFEALFILTAVDAGTRAGRFMVQDLLARAVPPFGRMNGAVQGLIGTGICVAAWGFFCIRASPIRWAG
jgi:carbon starvation protein